MAQPDDWYRDAVIYQLHVRSFMDSNGDGTGDFDGLTSRLDHVVDLGVDTLWLLPFFPSPLKDDGYDIADYRSINPAYGDMMGFRRFLAAAHNKGLRVVIEMVLNHTSDAHPWFQRARRAPRGSRHRDYYVWSDSPDLYRDARIIFQDFEVSNWTWDPVAQQYFWHRFYSHQPDLNFESPDVRRAMLATLGRWLRLGVDGVRLDAVPYLYEEDGTNCENLPKTHEFLKELRQYVDESFPGRMLLAEANQWPEDAVAYFGDGDECHMAFHFPVMPRLFMAVHMESRTPIVDILEQTPQIPTGCQWALFLRNHDELTLEMVTDEERDYMYRRFAGDPRMRVNLGIRRRLSPLLQDDRRRIELMNALLFSLPGTPIIYYGDEIGMGDNVYLGDRDAVRTPMQWSADRNAGFSTCNPQKLFLPLVMDPQHHFEAVNVEAQRRNAASLWWWMRRLVTLRRRQRAFGRGDMQIVESDNPKILAFIRSLGDAHRGIPEDDDMLVIANLSRHSQDATLATTGRLGDYAGVQPIEMFGQSRFAAIADGRHRVTLGPYDFLWLRLPSHERTNEPAAPVPLDRIAPMRLSAPLDRRENLVLSRSVAHHLERLAWFDNRQRTVSDLWIVDQVPLRGGDTAALLVEAEFTADEPQRFFATLNMSAGIDRPNDTQSERDHSPTALAETTDGRVLVDATTDAAVVTRFVQLVLAGDRLPGRSGAIVGRPIRRTRAPKVGSASVRPLRGEALTAAVVDDSSVLKFYRRIDAGVHPDAEVLEHLTEMEYKHSPTLLGTVEYKPSDGSAPMVLGTLTEFVSSEGTAHDALRSEIARFLEWAATTGEIHLDPPERSHAAGVPDELRESMDLASLLGRRTAELHATLASIPDARFRPEAFTRLGQRALYQAMRSRARSVYGRAPRVNDLPPLDAVLSRFERLTDHLLASDRVRLHGDLHLSQALVCCGEIVFIDFEGLPDRPVGERTIKRSPAVDVSSMMRSVELLAQHGLEDAIQRGLGSQDTLATWATAWAGWMTFAFEDAYVSESEDVPHVRLLPAHPSDRRLLLEAHALDAIMREFAELLDQPAGPQRDARLARTRTDLTRRLT